jgi:hypothetical protein
MSLAKKLKVIIKGELKPTFGTDPNEPWSARAGITEGEAGFLSSYLKSRGINPEFVSRDTKISHAKSAEFSKWKRDHRFDDPADYVSSVTRDKMKAQREEVQVDEAKTIQGTALDKFRQAAAERARKHDDIEREMKARHAAGKEDMKGSIDRLEKQLNKEESEVNEADQKFIDSLNKLAKTHKVGDSVTVNSKFFGKQKGKVTKVDNQSVHVVRDGKSSAEKYPHDAVVKESDGISKTKETSFHKKLDKLVHSTFGKRKDEMKVKEEVPWVIEDVEQIDEISKSTLDSYRDKSRTSLKTAQTNRDAAEPGKDMSKGFADLHAKSNAIAKKRVKGLMGYLQRKQGVKPMGEDVYQDPQAATQTAFDMGTQADDREPTYSRKKEMSKSARMIKSLYKKHKMVKEELYDHEKEDKSVATYGKKPKVEKVQVDGDENNQAAMVLKGGKTLTGQTRDTLEIDPVMRKPSSPNNKNSSTKTDK